MPVNEMYVVGYLLQESERVPAGMEWQEAETGGYATTFNLVRVRFYRVPGTGGARLCLEFGLGHDTVYVQEPCKVAMFGRPYRNEDEARVAELLHRLHAAVSRQVQLRQEAAGAMEAEIRETIFRRLLFGAPGDAGLDAGR
jgi:hypothetical protein